MCVVGGGAWEGDASPEVGPATGPRRQCDYGSLATRSGSGSHPGGGDPALPSPPARTSQATHSQGLSTSIPLRPGGGKRNLSHTRTVWRCV